MILLYIVEELPKVPAKITFSNIKFNINKFQNKIENH